MDDDFFDSPPPSLNESFAEYKSKSRNESSGKLRLDGTSSDSDSSKSTTARGSDSESESEQPDQSKPSRRSVVRGSFTKVPTGKSHEYNNQNSDSNDDKSGSSSESETSRSSRSSSRSASSESNQELKQAWVVESPSKTQDRNKLCRPKSAHHKYGTRVQRTPSSNASNSSEESRNKSRSNTSSSTSSNTSSLTESDMTDVSPLNSPNRGYTPKSSPKKIKGILSDKKPPQRPSHTEVYNPHTQCARNPRSKSACDGYEHLLRSDKDSVNLKVLMHAILEMEQNETKLQHNKSKKLKVPHKAPSVTSSISSQGSYNMLKKNYSFSNSRTQDIDRENLRLVNRIMKHGAKKNTLSDQQRTHFKQPMTGNHRLTSAAINRLKEQQRIDEENKKLLKRLESAKATKTLRKDELDRKLFSTTRAGVPLGVIHALKTHTTNRAGSKSPYQDGHRSHSALDIRRKDSAASSRSNMSGGTYVSYNNAKSSSKYVGSTQLKSAGRARPKSAHATTDIHEPHFRVKRPEWEAGW